MVQVFGHIKKPKDEYKYKEVIYRECFFYPVGTLELGERLKTNEVINNPAKEHGERYPDYSPGKRFLIGHHMRMPVKHAQVQQQHYNYGNRKSYNYTGVVNHVVHM
jgi:hypothetical protein